ncbi:cytochrome b [Pararobbsia silviterrae]|uniref:Cytochrome b n=1 Tax=Pararobbsia silviterrae TaxID=1792498 RepID=A0A494XRS2_9BURK|nr:cytochrome b [Pararobbsia silviterrae]RKP53330.1 cytochrome b [Pararobbsia silviterrae]
MTRFRASSVPSRYTGTAISLHWIIAILIAGAFWIGFVMTDIPGFTPTKLRYFSWHKWIGVTVFALVLVRLLWRLTHRAPPLPYGMPKWQIGASHAVHFALYLLMFAVPMSGYAYNSAAGIPVMYLGLVRLPMLIDKDPALRDVLKQVHHTLAWALLVVIGLHLLGVLKHLIIDRDGLLSRMLPSSRR